MSKQLTMKAGVAMFAALALAGVLAILAFSAYQPVAAQTGSTVTRGFNMEEVTPGGTLDVTITHTAPSFASVDVSETLPAGWTFDQIVSPAGLNSTSSGQMVSFKVATIAAVTYRVTASSMAGDHMFSGTFSKPGTTESGSVGGTSTVTVAAATGGNGGNGGSDLMVELSTNNAGADVSVEIQNATADRSITGGRDIEVTLPGFGIPSDIDDSDVILDGGAGSYYGNPADVSVSGDTITITLPTRIAGTNDPATISGSYSVLFKNSAGLSNPAYAKDGIEVTVSDLDADDETYDKVSIVATASVKPTFVTRGGDATVTAKGLRDGTTTVYLLEKDGKNYMRGAALGTGTAADGVVEIEIDTSGTALMTGATMMGDKDVGSNMLRVVDSNDGQVGNDINLGIKPTVKLGSETAKRSASLEISVSDWYYGNINEVTIAGLAAGIDADDTNDAGEVAVSNNKATFKVTVPGNVRTGEQEVKVSGVAKGLNTTSATAMVNVVLLPLDVSPSEVVPGHRVTITGSGFANNTDIKSISIGGVPIDVPRDADSTSSGRVAVTVTVPMTVGDGDKTVKLTVATRTGEGEITVPEPEITLNPATSVPGSVISVNGSGFAADGRVEVRFDGDVEEVGQADGSGDFHIRLEIPSDAGVGSPNEVKVEVRSDVLVKEEKSISATAEHNTPGPAITVPEQAQVGTLATISGTNFEPFTSLTVMVGGKDATPSNAETDKNGAFELEARVPRLSAGSHTITIEDGSTDENIVTETFRVVTTPVVSTPQEVFGDIIDAGILASVWRYQIDETGSDWDSFDPQYVGQPGINDLVGVARGDIVWIRVTENVMFQGSTLFAGWNLVTLE